MDRDQPPVLAAERIGLRRAHPRERADRCAVSLVIDEGVRRERDRRFQHAGLDAAPLAGALALVQRAEDAVGGIEAGDVVGQRRPAGLRRLRIDELAQHAAERLRHRVIGGPVGVGAVAPEAGDRSVDEPRVRVAEHFVGKAQPVEHAVAEIVDQHVGLLDQIEQDLLAARRAQIEREAALVAVVGDEMAAVVARRGNSGTGRRLRDSRS